MLLMLSVTAACTTHFFNVNVLIFQFLLLPSILELVTNVAMEQSN